MSQSGTDQCQRFLFDQLAIRGELTHLQQSYRDVLSQHSYPAPVARLLGEFMAAVSLLSDTLKFRGLLSLQARGAGQVRTVMAECEHHERLRAIARYTDDFVDGGPMLGEGQLAITIEPEQGQRYQGIVSLRDHGLAQALEDYFQQSEQIRTRVWLAADGVQAAGLLIQAMPESAHESSLTHDSDGWDRIIALADTLTDAELLTLDSERLLVRLFHEETVRTWPPVPRHFECTCSHERSARALRSIGYAEARQLAVEQGSIQVDCQFCRARYNYTVEDVEALFEGDDNTALN
ncbi:Hsp33 family molecular chaperone HslO [Natronospirillum operosum]|uniref:Hsp33 family molecular chaperone HslO n=1 Tax=Natronospirillum operosum TaxID=2759953 RepID=A0A4Z0W5T7_9GAMM|nr:Hsp33 family molecular chaperone HslO [Natronospirillum operosum]TGG91364.1 Hsp33 family molecular chaperone HslO [Natronospirillum operosum]